MDDGICTPEGRLFLTEAGMLLVASSMSPERCLMEEEIAVPVVRLLLTLLNVGNNLATSFISMSS